eukprot:1271515-Alexandrium_andersonii.AAC.1
MAEPPSIGARARPLEEHRRENAHLCLGVLELQAPVRPAGPPRGRVVHAGCAAGQNQRGGYRQAWLLGPLALGALRPLPAGRADGHHRRECLGAVGRGGGQGQPPQLPPRVLEAVEPRWPLPHDGARCCCVRQDAQQPALGGHAARAHPDRRAASGGGARQDPQVDPGARERPADGLCPLARGGELALLVLALGEDLPRPGMVALRLPQDPHIRPGLRGVQQARARK